MNLNPNLLVRISIKKFGISFETQGKKTSWRDAPGFLAGYPGGCPKV